jgi:hypothetical protein
MEQAKPTRMKFDVLLEAPEIKVPRGYSSKDLVSAQLGTLRLSNEIVQDKAADAEIDKMRIEVSAVSVQTELGSLKTPILKGVDMLVNFERSLSPTCTTVPQQKLLLDC